MQASLRRVRRACLDMHQGWECAGPGQSVHAEYSKARCFAPAVRAPPVSASRGPGPGSAGVEPGFSAKIGGLLHEALPLTDTTPAEPTSALPIETDAVIVGAGPGRPLPGLRTGPARHQGAHRRFAGASRAGSAPSSIPTSRSTTFRRCRYAARRSSSTGCMQQIQPVRSRLSPRAGGRRTAKREDGRFFLRTATGTAIRRAHRRDRGRARLVPAAPARRRRLRTLRGQRRFITGCATPRNSTASAS